MQLNTENNRWRNFQKSFSRYFLLTLLLLIISISITEAQTANFTGDDLFGCGPHRQSFTDASTTTAGTTITGWLWNFGDGGTSTNQNPSYTYNTPGVYSVSLTVTNSVGSTNTRTRASYVQVIGPNVNFGTTTARVLDAPGAVTFQDQTIFGAPITSWTWDFGDGGTSNLRNPTHTYNTAGTFNVSLTVTDIDGCSRTLTKTNFVNTISEAFDVSIGKYAGNEDRASNLESSARSLTFNNDGTKMFVLGEGSDSIFEYTLSTAYDISTASYTGAAESFSVAGQEVLPNSMVFNNDGTKMFVMGISGTDINEYNLNVAYDVSTAVFAGNGERFSVAGQETSPRCLTFNNDGTKMFVTGSDEDNINEYSLATGFDVSTATYAGNAERFSVAGQEAFPQSMVFSPDGLKMYVLGSAGDDINEYNLSVAYDVSTAVFAGNAERLSVASQENTPTSMAFNNDGTKIFVIGRTTKRAYEYSLAEPAVSGAVANQPVVENATVSPFAAITVADPNGDNVSATITLDDNAKGALAGTGLTGSGPYTLASTDAASLQTSLRGLVFAPTENRSAVSETTNFTLVTSDGTFSDVDNRTTVVSSAIAPTITISSAAADPNNGAFTATFTFSENVTGFTVDDIVVGNGAASGFVTTSASVYTATITPTANGSVTVDVNVDVAQDLGGANNTAGTQFSITADLTDPTVTITSSAADPTNGAITATFTFSEAVTGFVIGDITIGNGAASNFSTTSSTIYSATITPTTDGAMTVDVASNVAQDAATNGNTAATQFSITADLTSPTVTISSSAADPTNGAITATFTFSEAVTGFVIGDITVGNGAASNFVSTSTSIYSATITPTTDGAMTVDVASNVAQDAAINGNTAATQFDITADLTSPTVMITSSAANPINGAFTSTFTFSEAVTSFALGDISVSNGTTSDFASTSTSVYTATITPTATGNVMVDVASNVAQDAATNGNTAATQFSITADLTDPTVTITSSAADPTNGAITATFTFSEAITGFVLGDITVGNGAASNFSTTSSTIYSATITPTTNGAMTVDVASNVAQDAATNGNTAATQFSITADLTDPTVTITSSAVDPTNGAITATFTFSEAVTGFVIGDITVGNGAASNFVSTSTSIYTATITPTTDGAMTVDVASNVAQDAATNGNTAATQFSITADLTDPTVTITSSAADPTNGAITATFTFSEAVTGFVLGDITVGNGAASNFSTSSTVYTAIITPTTDGAMTVDVASNVAQDAATNGNTAATQFSITADLTDPTVTITSSSADPTNGAITATFTFSEAVTGFALGDITVGNGASSNFSTTSSTVYTATITPTTDGVMTVDVAANVAQDAATNGNTAATQFSITADLTDPTVLISSTAADPINGAFTTTFTFSEAVTGFDITDITVVNGVASAFSSTSTSVYTARITPSTDGVVTIDVATNAAQDTATNENTAATQFSITADLTAPTITITSSAANPINGAFTSTFTFSEAVTGFAVGDISISNGTTSDFASTSTSVYTATITPTATGNVMVDVAANVAQDAATNGNTAATQFNITADLTVPIITITSSAANPINGAFTAILTFSETVTGFAVGDIMVSNGAASDFVSTSTSVYTASITPTATGNVTVDVAANVAQDAATNGNTVATQFSIAADLTNPTVTITSAAANPINGAFTTTFTFSEAVTGFGIGDITVSNGAASDFASTSTSIYTATITPTTTGNVMVDVAANVAQDAATNGNTAATQFNITADLTSPTVTITSAAANPIDGAFTTTFTFSEAVTDFALGDISVSNGTTSDFASTSTSIYTATITPTATGNVMVDVAANVSQDAATNGNTAATQFSIMADLTDPTVTITSAAANPINGAFTATFTFSEAVTGFVLGGVTVANGTASAFTATSAAVYTALITPITDGSVTIDVNANAAQDIADNGNLAATQLTIVADFTSPTFTVLGIPAELNTLSPFTLIFEFSEPVFDFVFGDFSLTNATISGLASLSPTRFEGTFAAITNVPVVIELPLNTVQDQAGNSNSVGRIISLTFNSLPANIILSSANLDENNILAAEIGVLSTTDADVGEVYTYSLVLGAGDTDNDQFSITFDKFRAATSFDFETKSSFSVRVKTDDGRGGETEEELIITINDLNEQPTDVILSNTIINETDETDVLVGLFATTDQDNSEQFTYTLVAGIGDTNNSIFNLNNAALRTTQAINFEQTEVLSIRVRVTDSGGLIFDKVIEIAVVDVELEALRAFTQDSPDARIKNFFTPNGDGQNDTWVIEDIKDNPVNKVRVFSADGKVVFSAVNYQNDWEGNFDDRRLPSGTYFYEINISNGAAIITGVLLILNK